MCRRSRPTASTSPAELFAAQKNFALTLATTLTPGKLPES
jgi:hypothetical protein